MQCVYSESDDPIINDDTAREILSSFFLVALIQQLQSPLFIFLLNPFPLLDGLILLADISPIEDTNRLDIVIGQEFKHFQDVV